MWNKVGWGQKNHNPFKNFDDCLAKYANAYMNLCKVGGVKSFEYGDRIWKPCTMYTKDVFKKGKFEKKVVRFPQELLISLYWGLPESDWDEVGKCNLHPKSVSWICTERKYKPKEKDEDFKLDRPDDFTIDTEKGGYLGSNMLEQPTITGSEGMDDDDYQIQIDLTGSGGNK